MKEEGNEKEAFPLLLAELLNGSSSSGMERRLEMLESPNPMIVIVGACLESLDGECA